MIVVTGAYGFIGVYLVDELRRQGYDVLATGHRMLAAEYFMRRGIPYAPLDIAREEDFASLPTGVEGVVHLAGLLPANVESCPPQDYIRLNVTGTLNVLEYCRTHEVKRVLATTSYADIQNAWSVDPPTPSEQPRNFKFTGDHAMYVISKNAATDSILHYNQQYGFKSSVFRLPMVYGYGPHLSIYVDGQYKKSGFQVFMEKAKAGEPIEIWGNPGILRDVVYVKDVVQAFTRALRSEVAQGIYNISSGVGITLREQVQAMVNVWSHAGKESEIVLRSDKPNNLKSFVLDISRAQRDFGYQPAFTFQDMLIDYTTEEAAGTYDAFIQSRNGGEV